jgi:CofD-related protein of GAK system
MPSVGDLRNRMMALADEGARGNPEICALLSHRFPREASRSELAWMLGELVEGRFAQIKSVPRPLRTIVQTHLRFFADRMPDDFDLRHASVGNLVLAGGYLENDRDLDSVLYLFSKLVEVRGHVRPVVEADLHLAATLEDGTRVVGQHLITGKEVAPLTSRVVEFELVENLADPRPAHVAATETVCEQVRRADVLCFPMGSLYTSVLANLLPQGIGAAIAAAECPKVYVPSMGSDPEQVGLSTFGAVEQILASVRRDAGPETAADRILHAVFVDTTGGDYRQPLELERVREIGVEVVDLPLVSESSRPGIDPQRLAECLVSLA